MSNSIDVAGLRFTPNKDGFLVTRPYPGGESISGQLPIATLVSLRAAFDAHARDVVRPWEELVAAFRDLRNQKGSRAASERLRAIAGVDELGYVPRERYVAVTHALITEGQS